MKLLIGNFKGPKGEQGNEGKKGDNGDKGEKGERGSRWTSGTAITGTSTTETIFADSGITDAKIDDYYINTTTGNLYQCTASGAADTAKWVYIGNLKGPKGNDGPAGSISDINDQIPTYEESTQFENIESGEKVKIAFGKLKKALSVFIVHHTQKATAAILGHVKLSNSAAITKPGEYALDAIEKNATIEGTLAHLIDSQNNVLTNSINQLNSNMAMVGVSNPIFGSADIVNDGYNRLCNFTLSAGTHIIIAIVNFPSNDTGFRRIGISANGESFHINRFAVEYKQAISGSDTPVFLYNIQFLTKEETLYLMAQQNSGITLSNCIYGIHVLSVENAKRYTMPHEFFTPDSNV